MSRQSRAKRNAKSRKAHKSNGSTVGNVIHGYSSYREMILRKGERGKPRGVSGGSKFSECQSIWGI